MIETLPKSIGNVLRGNKDLTAKNPLKVLISLGSAHTRIYHWLHNRGENIKRVFPDMPYDFLGSTALPVRSVLFDKPFKKEKDKELIEQNFFFNLCSLFPFKNMGKILSDGEYQAYINFLKKDFSHEVMKSIYETSLDEKGLNPREFISKVFKFMHKNKLPVIITKKNANKIRNFKLSEENK